ncbi:MAG: DUF1934 domain-containing protein [Lachnospiraceae bacterium]|nr:DUF1934 domain-containing protein [Lachnospiraceae bacterium]
MTKDVLINISGMQFAVGEEETAPVEVVIPGQYYNKNGQHYLIYDEVMEENDGVTHNIVKFKEHKMEVSRKGMISVQMIFEENKKNLSYYQTPFGLINMGIAATGIHVMEKEEQIDVCVEYALDMNEAYMADCTLNMSIHAKN